MKSLNLQVTTFCPSSHIFTLTSQWVDDTILVHTIIDGSNWYIKKGGNAPRATDKKSM
jgi:hypothetical protein